MEDLVLIFGSIETKLLAEIREADEEVLAATEDELSAADRKQVAAEKHRQLVAELGILTAAKAELEALAERNASSNRVAVSDSRRPLGIVLTNHAAFSGPFSGFLSPEFNEQTGEPVYDVRILNGRRTNRERALAVARVYGPELRESSLAEAIFTSGQTNAANAKAARSSLSSLVRYGREWTRNRGWLRYVGDHLAPDWEKIRLLVEERAERRRRGTEESENAECCAIKTQTREEQ